MARFSPWRAGSSATPRPASPPWPPPPPSASHSCWISSAPGAFLFAEGEDPARARNLATLLERNGIEVQRTSAELPTSGLEPIGLARSAGLPPGSYLVPLDQPRGALAQALLEGEARMGPKPTYDITAWSLPIAFHVPAWRAKARPRVATAARPDAPPTVLPEAAWGYLLPAGHEGVEHTLATLLRDGFKATALAEPAQFQGRKLGAGTIVLRKSGNLPGLKNRLEALGALNRHPVLPTDTAQMTSGPDLGSNRALILKAPRIAILMDRPADATAFGALAHTLTEAGLPFVQLRAERLGATSLARFTHLVLVDDSHGHDSAKGKAWQQVLGEGGAAKLKAWIAEGGTLLAFQGGAAYASRAGLTPTGFHLLAKAAEEARLREKDPKREAPKADPAELVRPWDKWEDRALEESIPGAFLKVRVDGSHPLAWGLHAEQGAAVLDTSDPILELSPGGENPLHFAKEELKVSGLLPKAMEAKLHQTAWAIREKSGLGAVILLAGDPVFRAQTPFTRRLLFNAIFFGPYRPVME